MVRNCHANQHNNKQEKEGIDQFEPIILEEVFTLSTSFGEIAIPKSKEYNPKKGMEMAITILIQVI